MMRPRTRFWLLSVLLFAALGICAYVTAVRIQGDLLRQSQEALAGAQVPFYGLEIDGRDAVLTGFVASAEQADQIENLVAAVPGVREVRNQVTLERVAEAPPEPRQAPPADAVPTPSAPAQAAPELDEVDTGARPDLSAPAVAAAPAHPAPTAGPVRTGTPASLRVQRLGQRLFVGGELPDDGASKLLAAAVSRFGSANVTPAVRQRAGVAYPEWLDAPERIVELMALLQDNGRLTIEGRSAVLAGQVCDRRAQNRLEQAAQAIEGLDWRFDVFSRTGLGGEAAR